MVNLTPTLQAGHFQDWANPGGPPVLRVQKPGPTGKGIWLDFTEAEQDVLLDFLLMQKKGRAPQSVMIEEVAMD